MTTPRLPISTRNEFVTTIGRRGIPVDAPNLSPAQRRAAAAADLNQDGLVRGPAELKALWARGIDAHDDDQRKWSIFRQDAAGSPTRAARELSSYRAAARDVALEEQAARGRYARLGNRALDLATSANRRALVARSPQLDNLPETTDDDRRCGGAAVANALILDGDGVANARAVRAVAQDLRVALRSSEAAALRALARGQMTPREAASLQSLLYRLGSAQPGGVSDAGLTQRGLADLNARLRAHGGLPNTHQAQYRLVGDTNSAHWVLTHTHRDGRKVFADSWPSKSGLATARTTATGEGSKTSAKARWLGSFTIRTAGGGLSILTDRDRKGNLYSEHQGSVRGTAFTEFRHYRRLGTMPLPR